MTERLDLPVLFEPCAVALPDPGQEDLAQLARVADDLATRLRLAHAWGLRPDPEGRRGRQIGLAYAQCAALLAHLAHDPAVSPRPGEGEHCAKGHDPAKDRAPCPDCGMPVGQRHLKTCWRHDPAIRWGEPE